MRFLNSQNQNNILVNFVINWQSLTTEVRIFLTEVFLPIKGFSEMSFVFSSNNLFRFLAYNVDLFLLFQ